MTWAELVAAAEAIRSDAALAEPRLAAFPIVGVGWATVEAERAVDELASVLARDSAWVTEARDGLLGAKVLRRDSAPANGPDLFVLEPDTEGRLAAFLARFGEGVGAVYLEAARGEADRVVADRVVPVHPRWGPYAVVRSRGGRPGVPPSATA